MVVPSQLIEAKIFPPPTVETRKDQAITTVDVRCELANVSEEDYVLHAPTEDDVQFWHVLDERHREIFRERVVPKGRMPKKATHPFRSHTLAAGHTEHENQRLQLKTSRLKDGHTYTVRAEFFGQIAEAEFVVFFRAAKAAAKKTTARKTTKKKPARKATKRKTAKKKPAKRKATRRKSTKRKAGTRKAAKRKTSKRKAAKKRR